MRAITLLQPGRLTTRTGGSIYNRRMVDGLRALGHAVTVDELDGSFPFPTATAVEQGTGFLAAVPDGDVVIADSLVVAPLDDVLVREASRLRIVPLMHLPLALTPNLDPAMAADFGRREARVMKAAPRVIVTGRATVDALSAAGVDRSRVVVVEPGVDAAAPGHGSGTDDTVRMLCVASVVRGKGHDLLVAALSRLADRRWELTCVGSVERDPEFVEALKAQAQESRIVSRVLFTGELDEDGLASAYSEADLFVLPTRLETYGMAVAEAIAHGLPVVSTATGAIPSLVGDLAGLVIAPDDAEALRGALALVMDDKSVRRRFRAGAIRMRTRLRSWDAAAREFSAAVEAAARG